MLEIILKIKKPSTTWLGSLLRDHEAKIKVLSSELECLSDVLVGSTSKCTPIIGRIQILVAGLRSPLPGYLSFRANLSSWRELHPQNMAPPPQANKDPSNFSFEASSICDFFYL